MKPLDPEQQRWHESETHRAYQGGKKVGYAEALAAFREGVETGRAYELGRNDGAISERRREWQRQQALARLRGEQLARERERDEEPYTIREEEQKRWAEEATL